MTREEAAKVLEQMRESLGPGVGQIPEARALVGALSIALTALRPDSDVRREERERCAKAVEELGRWADCELDPAATAKAIRALEDER